MHLLWTHTSILSKVGHVGAYVSEINRNQGGTYALILRALFVNVKYTPRCTFGAPFSSKIEAYRGFRMHD